MNKSARKAVNLSVLQRHDPHISDIIDSSSYVVVYKFDEDSQAWTKKGVEGTMFVFKRSTLPSYGFFIMNRLGIDNLMADLTGDMALQLTSDYIIYRDEKDIHGIWVYEPTDRDRIGEKLMDCCKKAKVDSHSTLRAPAAPSSSSSTSSTAAQDQPIAHRPIHSSADSTAANAASADPLTRMLSDAMSRARVSETSGAPLTQQQEHQQQQSSVNNTNIHSSPIALREEQQHQPPSSTESRAHSSGAASTKPEIPSFLLAIISKDQDKPSGLVEGSPSLQHQQSLHREMDSTQSMLLNSLTGSGKGSPTVDRKFVRQTGPPLSAELLPASVMPSGLYSNSARANGGAPPSGPGMGQHLNNMPHPSPSSTMAAATLLNRPNGAGIPSHGSPMQAPAFAYSPGMMPLAMPPMQGGPLMRPPPPPPLPFQHHPGLSGGGPHPMGLPSHGMPPPPPLPQPGMVGPSFPADAMHAAMGAVGFMQQQQRGFVGNAAPGEVMSKAEFAQHFVRLLQNDPQFMDVLYSNYTAVLARRG